jgi:hypothetical protein
MRSSRRTLLLGWLLTVVYVVGGCDSRKLPRFADPPPVDGGGDAAADDDAGHQQHD